MKALLSMAFALCCAVSFAEFLKVPTAEKLKAKDLTFAVTFDNFTLNANFAKGDARSITLPDTQLMLRGSIGFDGQQAYRPIPGESLLFDAVGNANPHEGTLSLWYRGIDWAPGSLLTNGQKRGNIALAYMRFVEKKRYIRYHLYQYDDTVYFEWWTSEPPHGWGTYGQLPVSIRGVKANEWVQIVVTWKGNEIAAYLNGEPRGKKTLPAKYVKTSDLKPEKKKSVIGIKSTFHGDKHKWQTEVDDAFIFSRALTDLEIRNRYQKLVKGGSKLIREYDVTLGGVDTGKGRNSDQMEALFDFSALPDAQMKQLNAGKLKVDWKLTSPSGKVQKGSWTFAKTQESRFLKNVKKPGNWKLETSIAGLKPAAVTIVQPDLSYIGNRIGEDTIPALWKDFAFDASKRTFTLWNRKYVFGNGILPRSIKIGRRELLKSAPKLLINGAEPLWTPGKVTKDAISYTLETTGRIANAVLICRTRVEFDGAIMLNFKINGKPVISSMTLDWQVEKPFAQYLLTPYLFQKKDGRFASPYPTKINGVKNTEIWFAAEKIGGFAFAMPHDANWRYKPEENVLFADKNTGKCRVTPVTMKSQIPQGASYRFFFIATPTRPLPEKNRAMRYSDYGYPGAPFMDGCSCQGQKNTNSYEPHPTAFEFYCRPLPKLTKTMYGCADSLADDNPVGMYFRRYWDIPGASSYKMPHRPRGRYQAASTMYNSLPACAATSYPDYILANQKKVFEHPYGDRIWMIYYDLCGNGLCTNPLHGHQFRDAFGRTINSYHLEAKRNLVRRTVAQAHKYGRVVMLHAQRDFNPLLQGMADYYFPGEQYQGKIMNAPYTYTDSIPDEMYRSEHNRDVLGVGVIFLPVLGYIPKGYSPASEKYVIGMLTMLQLHDVETCGECIANGPWRRMEDILCKYNLQDKSVKCFKYYEPGNNIRSSDPDIRVTRYECPGNKHLLFLANKTKESKTATIDISAIAKGNFAAQEEWCRKTVAVQNGKFTMEVPARSFRIVAFPPVPNYPVCHDMDKMWSIWKSMNSDVLMDHDEKVGCQAPPSIRMTNSKSGKSGAFTRSFFVVPGRTYTIRVKTKSINADRITLSMQFGHGMSALKLNPVNRTFKPSKDWQEVTLTYTIPTKKGWENVDRITIAMSGAGKGAVIWFDDFEIEER